MLIAKRTFVRRRVFNDCWFWESQTCSMSLCHNQLVEVFELSRKIRKITVALYTKPGPQRVELRYLRDGEGLYLAVSEKLLLDEMPMGKGFYEVNAPDEDIPELKKSKRKIFYAEVSWEE